MFIVHGHDNESKLTLKNYLQNTLNLPEPLILHEQIGSGKTLIEKFEDSAESADIVFVLLTPDDMILSEDKNSSLHRARPIVVYELGYFRGVFGRKSGRIILLCKGVVDFPSDIYGLTHFDMTDGIVKHDGQIRRELKKFGYNI